jgi:hypothetical protein
MRTFAFCDRVTFNATADRHSRSTKRHTARRSVVPRPLPRSRGNRAAAASHSSNLSGIALSDTGARRRGSGDVSIAPRGRRLDNRMSDDLFYRPNMSDVEHRAWDGRSRSLMALSVFLPFRFSPLHRKCPGVELPGNHQFVVYEDSCLDSRVTILQLAFVFGYLGLLLRVFTCRSTRCAGNARFGLWSEAATQTTQIGERDVGTVVAAGFFVESDVRFRCQVLAC